MYNMFLQIFQFSPFNINPQLLHTQELNYHSRSITLFSQYFSFPLSVKFHMCYVHICFSTTRNVLYFSPSNCVFLFQYHSTIPTYSLVLLPPNLYNIFLHIFQFSPFSIIPQPLLTH